MVSLHYITPIITGVHTVTGSALNDGQWHSVDLSVRRGRLILAVDKSDMSTITTSFPVGPADQIFFGGESIQHSLLFSRPLVRKVGSRDLEGSVKHIQEVCDGLISFQWWKSQISVIKVIRVIAF